MFEEFQSSERISRQALEVIELPQVPIALAVAQR